MAPRFRIEALADTHDRSTFTCGSEAMDKYFRTQAAQDMRRRVAACFVAVETETSAIAGFYTLSATGVGLTDLPQAAVKKLPRYPVVPAALIGRLAVASAFQNAKLGAALLADALTRALKSDLMVFAIFVDAKDDNAAAFYAKHGFEPLGGGRRMFITAATALKGLEG